MAIRFRYGFSAVAVAAVATLAFAGCASSSSLPPEPVITDAGTHVEEEETQEEQDRSSEYKKKLITAGEAVGDVALESVKIVGEALPKIDCGSVEPSSDEKKKFLCVTTESITGESFDTELSIADSDGFGFSFEFLNNDSGQ